MAKKKDKKSIFLEEKEEVEIPDYTNEETEYLGALQKKLEEAKDSRDKVHNEFDGMSYISYIEANERGANTFIEAKKNRGDTVFQSGTLRTKLLAFLSSFQSLNLQADIQAYDENNIAVGQLGNGLEDIIRKTEEIEGDEEKKMLRQYEMLKLGDVFVEDVWNDKWEVTKKIKKGFTGVKADASWSTKTEKCIGNPERNIVPNLSVYLGNLNEYLIENQPYIYTVEHMSYEKAKEIYGEWEMWKYVSKEMRKLSGHLSINSWLLYTDEAKKGQVERIIYQDKPNNEFQIIINGVPMMPMGYPLSGIRADGEYTIAQQHLEPIRHDFAYGKSFIFKAKNQVAVLDEMMKLAVLKTQKSFMPPYLNLSSKVLSKDMLMPGHFTRGVRPGEVQPVHEKEVQGVTAAEFSMMQEVKKYIDSQSVSQTFSGQKESGGRVTATQILELQRQSRMMMGMLTLSATLLEKKLATKRLATIIEKWFEPTDKVLDKARGILKNKYRITSTPFNIPGKGNGARITIPSDEKVSSEQVKQAEDEYEKKLGPVKLLIINPKVLKQIKYTWIISVNAREKKSSELSKILFDEMMSRAGLLAQQGLLSPINPDYADQKFAEVWDLDASKAFMKRPKQQMQPEQQTPGGGQSPLQGQVAKPKLNPQVKMPPGE